MVNIMATLVIITWKKLATQISVLGPIGGLYGRDIEQEIMSTQRHNISMVKFEHSVTISKCAIRQSAMNENDAEADWEIKRILFLEFQPGVDTGSKNQVITEDQH